jgi:hypothetical protein
MVRMWNVPPELLCDQHLLGEHYETHMIAGMTTYPGMEAAILGLANTGMIETHSLQKRHDELVAEMRKRGMRHLSPLDFVDTRDAGTVNVETSLRVLAERCTDCARRQAQRRTENEALEKRL